MKNTQIISDPFLKELKSLQKLLGKYLQIENKTEYLELINLISPIIKSNSEERLDKICYRFRVEDIGVPQKTTEGFKIKRVMYYDSDCEESLIPHTNIHGRLDKSNSIRKIPNGEYDTFKGKSNWKSKQVKEKLIAEGGGQKSFWIRWKTSVPYKKIQLNTPLPIDLSSSIFPDEESDYVDKKGNWSSNGKKQLEAVRDTLNTAYKNKEFKTIEIQIIYNCGNPRGMTGSDCQKRAKNAVKNTIKRLFELGLKIPKDAFKKQTINAFQTEDKDIEKGIQLKIIPQN